MIQKLTSRSMSLCTSQPLAAQTTFWLDHSAVLSSHAKPSPHFASPGRVPVERCCARPFYTRPNVVEPQVRYSGNGI
jgi:hypothetical protein